MLNFIKSRRTVRHYTKESVSLQKIEMLIDAAIWAPSSCNRQPLFFVVVTNDDLKKTIARSAYNQRQILDANFVIVVFVDLSKYDTPENNLAPILDTGVAMQNILLMAHALGLGACPIAGKLEETRIRVALKAPDYLRPTALITVGNRLSIPPPPEREALTKFYSFDKFERAKKGIYENVLVERRKVSRSGGDVALYYRRPAEGINLFANVRQWLKKHVEENEMCLITFSGFGYFIEKMPRNVHCAVFSLDERWFLRQFKRIKNKLIATDPLTLASIEANTYDCIVSIFDLHFMAQSEKITFLENCYRVLKQNGRLILIFLNKNSLYGINYLTSKSLQVFNPQKIRPNYEIPIDLKEVLPIIKDVLSKKVRKIKLETTGFSIPTSLLYIFPFAQKILGKIGEKLDFLKKLSKYHGNICFVVIQT